MEHYLGPGAFHPRSPELRTLKSKPCTLFYRIIFALPLPYEL